MGLLSKIFQNLKKSPEKLATTSHFGLKDVSVIENWILCFSTLRNICPPHGRVWNRRLIQIKLPNHPTHTHNTGREYAFNYIGNFFCSETFWLL